MTSTNRADVARTAIRTGPGPIYATRIGVWLSPSADDLEAAA